MSGLTLYLTFLKAPLTPSLILMVTTAGDNRFISSILLTPPWIKALYHHLLYLQSQLRHFWMMIPRDSRQTDLQNGCLGHSLLPRYKYHAAHLIRNARRAPSWHVQGRICSVPVCVFCVYLGGGRREEQNYALLRRERRMRVVFDPTSRSDSGIS